MFVDPKSLLPALPKPSELQPFPQMLSQRYSGHVGRVRSVAPHPAGQWMASGGDDGTIRLWEVATGRCRKVWRLGEAVACVAWCPDARLQLLSAAVGQRIVLLLSGLGGSAVDLAARTACKVWRQRGMHSQ